MRKARYKISILVDKTNDWIYPYAKELLLRLTLRGHDAKLYDGYEKIGRGDFLFMLGYCRLLPAKYLRLNKHNLVVHESALPKGRGFSPLTWQVLEGKNKIPIVLFEAANAADSGRLFLRDNILLSGFELNDEIRQKQGEKTVEIILKFVDNFSSLKSSAQKGAPAYYRKRDRQDSRLSINKNISGQFNLLRAVDNNRYPAFFDYKGHRYILKIHRQDSYLKEKEAAPANRMLIRNKTISRGGRCFIIGEVGSNHNKDKKTAKKLIRAIYESGADAVKFQAFKGNDIANKRICANAYGRIPYAKEKKYWFEVLDSLSLPYEWYAELIDYAHSLGLAVIATPESIDCLSFLETQDIDAYKIASMDLTYVQLLERISLTAKPLLLSTGMATLEEVRQARGCLDRESMAILHCVSKYPLLPKDANINNLNNLKAAFPLDSIGFSDHSLSNLPALIAVSQGAKLIEKHVTLDVRMPGPDHHFSQEPLGLTRLVQDIRLVEKMLLEKEGAAYPVDRDMAFLYRRSIHAAKDIGSGKVIRDCDVKIVRDESGLKPELFSRIIGSRARRNIKAEEPINFADLLMAKVR